MINFLLGVVLSATLMLCGGIGLWGWWVYALPFPFTPANVVADIFCFLFIMMFFLGALAILQESWEVYKRDVLWFFGR